MLPISLNLPSGSSDSPTPSAPEGRVLITNSKFPKKVGVDRSTAMTPLCHGDLFSLKFLLEKREKQIFFIYGP